MRQRDYDQPRQHRYVRAPDSDRRSAESARYRENHGGGDYSLRDTRRVQQAAERRDIQVPEEYDDPQEEMEEERRLDELGGGGRVGGASGYGMRDRIIGQTSSSMLLGQEGGWHETGPRVGARPAIGWSAERRSDFRGRGPKGYERSDERLLEIVCERLTEDPHVDASEIVVQVANKEVTLTGNINDRWSKYHVEEIVEDCGGVREIHNQLRVNSKAAF
jgi:osmotically-inducible protein OsmY